VITVVVGGSVVVNVVGGRSVVDDAVVFSGNAESVGTKHKIPWPFTFT